MTGAGDPIARTTQYSSPSQRACYTAFLYRYEYSDVPAKLFRLFLCTIFLFSSAWAAARNDSGTVTVELGALPPEARQTLMLIDRGGPFPYRRDGIVFQNRERRLPLRERGCYREYTVPTPGSDDRGARRIITACEGVQYYTSNHYRSFRRILR